MSENPWFSTRTVVRGWGVGAERDFDPPHAESARPSIAINAVLSSANPHAFAAMAAQPKAFAAVASNANALKALSANANAFAALRGSVHFQALAANPEARYSMEELSIIDAFNDLPLEMRQRLASGERTGE